MLLEANSKDLTEVDLENYLSSKDFIDVTDKISDWNDEQVIEDLISEDDWCYAKTLDTKMKYTIYWVSVDSSYIYRFGFDRYGTATSYAAWFYDETTGDLRKDNMSPRKTVSEFYMVSR